MTIGIPKGLLYSKYHIFAQTFFEQIGAKIVVSPDTNKNILNLGIKYCIDEACLPIKVFHGHVSWLRDRCDYILVPRFMRIEKNKSICPMFCGLNEMISNSIPGLPCLIDDPIYCLEKSRLLKWSKKASKRIATKQTLLEFAFEAAIRKQSAYHSGINNTGYPYKIGLIGHTYNIHDTFINMNLVKKLNLLGIGVTTTEYVSKEDIETEVSELYKPPFWYFARQYYGAAVHLYKKQKIDGIVYVSAFSCGIDSVVIELIKHATGNFPFIVLKIDEHTGEIGFNTRIEAFADMLKRRSLFGNHSAPHGKYVSRSESII